VRGISVVSAKKRAEIFNIFDVDLDSVPESRRFVYAYSAASQVSIDMRRSLLKLGKTTYFLAQISPDAYVVKFENRADLAHFQQDVAEHGITTDDNGDLKRAVIPASDVRIYYAKS